MTSGPLTADGQQLTSVQALADILGCHRNRISKWRRGSPPAPDGLDLGDWITWLRLARKPSMAARLSALLVDLSDDGVMDNDITDVISEELEEERVAKARRARADADRAELALARERRQVVPRQLIHQTVRRYAMLTVEVIAPGIWTDLLDSMRSLTPEQRQSLRRAHDAAIIRQRTELVAAGRQALTEILPAEVRA